MFALVFLHTSFFFFLKRTRKIALETALLISQDGVFGSEHMQGNTRVHESLHIGVTHCSFLS